MAVQHLNSKIHHVGVELIAKYWEKQGRTVEKRPNEAIKDWVEITNPYTKKVQHYPTVISVKTFTHQYETEVTGMNLTRIAALTQKQKDLHLGIYCLFVDAKKGWIYGQFLATLNHPTMDRAVKFPVEVPAGGQYIRYWSILKQMHKFCKLDPEDRDMLISMHQDNGEDANQLKMF